MLLNAFVVGCGGFFGAALRYLISALSNLVARATTGQEAFLFPVGTFAVNFLGCFAMGLLAYLIPHRYPGADRLLLFATTGVLGGFTTFSTFCLDAYNLFLRGEYIMAALSVLLTLVACGLGLVAGVFVAHSVTSS